MDDIFKQYVQLTRSQGADGPQTEHEELITKEFLRIFKDYSPQNTTPWLIFANGWKAALDATSELENKP